MIFEILPLGPLQTNCYLIGDNHCESLYVIDPGGDPHVIIERVNALKRRLKAVIATHCHIDHVGALADLVRYFNTGFIMHENEQEIVEHLPEQALFLGISCSDFPSPSKTVKDGDRLATDNHFLQIIHTPGHTPGSICLYHEKEELLFCGDTLFYESVGRTDLPGGNMNKLLSSIEKKIFTLPETVKLFPGHGRPSTIAHEKKYNPFTTSHQP